MICPQCQKIIVEGSERCPFCSEPFRENEGVVIKKHYAKRVLLPIGIAVFIISLLFSAFCFFTDSLRKNSAPLQGETFSNAKEALAAYDAYENKRMELDAYYPPYELIDSFDYEGNTIVLFSYCYSYDGQKCLSAFEVRILEHTANGKLSFGHGFIILKTGIQLNPDEYCYTTIQTENGEKTLGAFYLPKTDKRDIYLDGIKAKKELVNVDGKEFYFCYALSNPDTEIKKMLVPVSKRHSIEIK